MKKITIIISLLILISCSGCFSKFVHIYDRYPIYEMPPKANLEVVTNEELNKLDEKTTEKIIKTVQELKSEANQLRAILKSYNDYASGKNKQYETLFK